MKVYVDRPEKSLTQGRARTHDQGSHKHEKSKFPDFSLTKTIFPWPVTVSSLNDLWELKVFLYVGLLFFPILANLFPPIIFFKYFQIHNKKYEQAIVINYLCCLPLTSMHTDTQNDKYLITHHPRIPRGDFACYINPWDNKLNFLRCNAEWIL